MLKDIVDFFSLLIGAEGTLTPAGVRGRGDPAGAKSAEEAPLHARGKQVPGAEINSQINIAD